MQTTFGNVLKFAELEKDLSQWKPNFGPDIDQDPPDKMLASTAFDGSLQIDNVSCVNVTKPGGGLVSRKLPYDSRIPLKLPYSGLDMEFMLVAGNFARIEVDRKDVSFGPPNSKTPVANTDDFSSQLNGSLGWQFQVDDVTRKWALPATGYTPTCFKNGVPMMQWLRFSARYFTDFTNGSFSYRSIAIGDDAPFLILPGLKPLSIPRMNSNWSPVIDVQLQLKGSMLGVLTARYRRISVTFSDVAF